MTERARGTAAAVIGSGPNGLAAAIVLAAAGLEVDVYEAAARPGGAAASGELTLAGFRHDLGSAVHPLAAGSPFFASLELGRHGLEWIHGEAVLAHPLDDGTAVVLERDPVAAAAALAPDGDAWRRMVGPLAHGWAAFADEILRPPLHVPRHPTLLAHFALRAAQPAALLAGGFQSPRTRALFAGLAAHSGSDFRQPLGAAVAVVLAAAAHAVGWPIPRGGAQSISDALLACLAERGGRLHTGCRVASLAALEAGFPAASRSESRGGSGCESESLPGSLPGPRAGSPPRLVLADVSPRGLLAVAGERLRPAYARVLRSFRHGPGAFKLDYALAGPIPWRAPACSRAITVHLGGSFEQIAAAEHEVARGRHPRQPFVLLAQPSLYDRSRAPAGAHTAWAYCHVPNGSEVDMTERIEAQIERFAPGFRDLVLARRASAPADLEAANANLVGGDVNGGAFTPGQILLRPTAFAYSTGTPGLYLCSASTPPGGGVHGMCGYHAARMALRSPRRRG